MKINLKKVVATFSVAAISIVSIAGNSNITNTQAAAWNGQRLPYDPIGKTNYDFSNEYVRATGTNAGSVDTVDKSTLILSTPDQYQHTAFWNKTQINIKEAFSIKFDWYMGASTTKRMTNNAPAGGGAPAAGPADGLAFVIQGDDRGANAVGNTGGGMGYDTIKNAVVSEWDTYNDDWVTGQTGNGESWNHFAMIATNSYGNQGYGNTRKEFHNNYTKFSDLGIAQNGNESYYRQSDNSRWQNIEVKWAPIAGTQYGTYSTTTNGVTKSTVVDTVAQFGGKTMVNYGFTGGTGRDVSMQAIRINKVIPDPYEKVNTTKELSQGQSSEVNVGDIVKYTVKVKNNGIKFANEKVLTDPLDKRFEYVSSTQSGAYDPINHKVNWNVPSLNPEKEFVAEITLRVKSKK